MRTLLAFVVFASASYAQAPTAITVTGPIYQIGNGSPQLMNGTLDLTARFTLGNVIKSGLHLQIINGAFAGTPNLKLAPGQYTASYCSVRVGGQGCVPEVLYWTVPTSGGPYTVASIQSVVASTPPLSVILSQLPKPPDGQTWCIVSVNNVATWTQCPSGGTVVNPSTLFDNFTTPVFTSSTSVSFDNATD